MVVQYTMNLWNDVFYKETKMKRLPWVPRKVIFKSSQISLYVVKHIFFFLPIKSRLNKTARNLFKYNNRIAIARTWVESWLHRRPRLRPFSPSFSSSHRRSGQLTGLEFHWNKLFLLSLFTFLEIDNAKTYLGHHAEGNRPSSGCSLQEKYENISS